MRKTFVFLLNILLFIPCQYIKPQNYNINCDIPETHESFTLPKHYVGRYITSTGILRVLVIFVRFADDIEETEIWPDFHLLPDWAQSFVNNKYSSTGDYYPETVSRYFYENSYGKLHVIGDVYFVTTDHDENYYHQLAYPSNPKAARSTIEKEVLDKLDDQPYNVDFSLYDNWTYSGEFNNEPGKDSQVDMIWFITRNLHDENYKDNYRFGVGYAKLDCPTHFRDGVKIIGSCFPGSGIGMFEPHVNWAINSSLKSNGSKTIVNHVAHEMTHYLYGQHFADLPRKISSSRYSSSLKTYAGGWRSVYSGYEKWRLGWITPKTITSNGDGYVLYDLASTINEPEGPTNSRLFKIDIPGTNQFFLIENRQWISEFEPYYAVDCGRNGLLKPGILIYHFVKDDEYLSVCRVIKLDAEGRFRWKMLYHGTNNSSMNDDVIDKEKADRKNGYTESENIFIEDFQGQYWQATWHPSALTPYGGGPYQCKYSHGGTCETTDLNGDSLDLYQVGDVLTPWSNPPSDYWNGTSFSETNIGIQILSFNPTNKSYTIAVRIKDPISLAPAKPQNLTIEDYNGNPKLIWDPNLESDVSKYKIYKKKDSINFVEIATVLGRNNCNYVDTEEDIIINTSIPNKIPIEYKVKAIDTQGKESNYSEEVETHIEVISQITSFPEQSIIVNGHLSANYPNPFNPTTKIKYSIPKQSLVTLKVYDDLGKQVQTLVNEVKSIGNYEVNFNASNLASGVYFYRLQAGNFIQTKKMMLLK